LSSTFQRERAVRRVRVRQRLGDREAERFDQGSARTADAVSGDGTGGHGAGRSVVAVAADATADAEVSSTSIWMPMADVPAGVVSKYS